MPDVDLPAGFSGFTQVGAGSAGQVYRARDDTLGRPVAVKLFSGPVADDPAVLETFRRECAAVSRLSGHPGVVTVYSAGLTPAGRPWLCMQYVEGGPLSRVLRSGPLPVAEALRAAVLIADTLAFAHSQDPPVLHCDVKPGNILLTGDGRPLLGDFGVAVWAGAGRSSVTVRGFTQAYAAPEVLYHGRFSPASEVWSLAATLFEMITGLPPFEQRPGEGTGAFIERVTAGLPGDATVGLAEPLRGLLSRGLAVDREARWPSAAAFAAAIRQTQAALGLPATPAGTDHRPPGGGGAGPLPWAGVRQAPAEPRPADPGPAADAPASGEAASGEAAARKRRSVPHWWIPAALFSLLVLLAVTIPLLPRDGSAPDTTAGGAPPAATSTESSTGLAGGATLSSPQVAPTPAATLPGEPEISSVPSGAGGEGPRTLVAGDELVSPDARYALRIDGDGRLVLRNAQGMGIWYAGSDGGSPGSRLEVTEAGRLVLSSAAGAVLWDAGVSASPRARLRVTDAGSAVLEDGGRQVWSSGEARSMLHAGERLDPGQSLVSENGGNVAWLLRDGNFVVYRLGDDHGEANTTWSSGTRDAGYLVLQPDGNLVLYDESGTRALWSTSTQGAGEYLWMRDDGSLVVCDVADAVIWSNA
ncbi:protein kinase domain-containing protein [Frankia nepalensis]|uniref:protein kinase domain-containing protein n=1 Tax=Frankia nepalensis TaxID=1836974 RepID=UPI0019311BAE|nr:protein kinase [Frankia nepalensis]